MKLHKLKTLLAENPDKQFRLQLPDESLVPISFHITEVGQINKTFIDCGGKVHSTQTCQMQVWLGPDEEHRLSTDKLASILDMSSGVVTSDDIDVEIEYETTLISQYPVSEYSVNEQEVTLHLTTKHTDCLAKELCLLPMSATASSCGCTPSGCC